MEDKDFANLSILVNSIIEYYSFKSGISDGGLMKQIGEITGDDEEKIMSDEVSDAVEIAFLSQLKKLSK
jgi:hypothetical protein